MRATREVIAPVWAKHVWYLLKLFFAVDESGVKVLADSWSTLDEQQMACYLCELELCCCDHFTDTLVHPLSWSLKLNMSW